MSKKILSKLIGLTSVEARESIEFHRFECREFLINENDSSSIFNANRVNIFLINGIVVRTLVG